MSPIDLDAALRRRLHQELPAAIALRHQLHQHPRLSGEEHPSRDTVLAALAAAGPSTSSPRLVAGSGAVLRYGGPGPAIAVRAELDALAMTETSAYRHASRHPGLMHACGHDVHLAALVALARAVHATLQGDAHHNGLHDGHHRAAEGLTPLLVVLQPREESYPSGALDVATSGVLFEEDVRAAIGAHVHPGLPRGTVACTPGAVNASSDEFAVTVTGSGGHAAYPHQAGDPVAALAHVVVALQSLVSRRVDPMAAAVLSVTVLSAGTAANVIPAEAGARGTIRCMDGATRARMLEQLAQTVDLVARAHGCRGDVAVTAGEPVLFNDPAIVAGTAQVLHGAGTSVEDQFRSAGSDDFSYFCEQVPSVMLFVGTDTPGERLHNSTFVPPDNAVADVAEAMLAGYLAAGDLTRRPAAGAVDAVVAS